MKKIAQIALSLVFSVAALMLLVSTASATTSNTNTTSKNVRIDAFKAMELKVTANAENTVRVAVANPTGSDFQVKLRDAQDNLLWWQNVSKSEAYLKNLNLSKLPAGTYTVEIVNDQTVYTQTIEVK